MCLLQKKTNKQFWERHGFFLKKMYQAIGRIFVSRTKLARTCLSVTSLLEILVYARDTDEGFALVARFLHDSRLVERSAAEFAQEQPFTEYRSSQ